MKEATLIAIWILSLGAYWWLLIYQYFEITGKGELLNVKGARKPKRRLAALALNLFPLPLGLGYLYLGEWKRFLYYFLGWQFLSLRVMPDDRSSAFAVWAMIWIFTMFDLYRKASGSLGKDHPPLLRGLPMGAYLAFVLAPPLLFSVVKHFTH